MRAFLILVIGLSAIVFGNYWFNPYVPICRLPVSYAIGEFDERFGVSREEALTALALAESVWEEALNRDDIFNYDPEGPFKINFIYDERQRQAEAAEGARAELETRGGANEVLTELHRRLVLEYSTLENEYEERRVAYENNLAAYNAEVERYNAEGGAPEEEYDALKNQRESLDSERQELENMIVRLEGLAEQINEVGDKGNELIDQYNEQVEDFNYSFAHGHEYTQGDYGGRQINIYTFTNQEELVLVLMHELGHALSIGHVEDPSSIMYYLMQDQPYPPQLSGEDREAFRELCEASVPRRLLASLSAVYNSFIIDK